MPIVEFAFANVGIYSFDANTVKPVAHYEFDLTSFRDPINRKEFDDCMDGTDPKIQEWIKKDRRFPAIMSEVKCIAHDQKNNQGGRWLTIAFRDHHGKWKSRAMATLVGEELSKMGYNVNICHFSGVQK